MKDLDYQPNKSKQSDQQQQSDQELSLWIQQKDEFNKLKDCILSIKDNKLKTGTKKYQYDFSDMKRLIKDVADKKSYKR